MSTTLPKTINLETTRGDKEVEVLSLGSTDVPDHDGGSFRHHLGPSSSRGWDGWHREKVKPHLLSWSFPKEAKSARDRCENILEECIPNQKRTMLRNQAFGLLDQKWIPQIAVGHDVERPFQRWSKNKRDTISVAICLDTTVACAHSEEMIRARMVLIAGLASALEHLDYEVAVIGAHIFSKEYSAPRLKKTAALAAITCKDWNEPFSDSAMAHMADTGLRRLMVCWEMQGNNCLTALSDREWRDLTQADLLIYVGSASRGRFGERMNSSGIASDAKIGPVGPDTLRLDVDKLAHVDPAISKLETFFDETFGG